MTMPPLMIGNLNVADVNESFRVLEELTLEQIPGEIAESVMAFDDHAANLVFASPDGAAGEPDFRALVTADLPDNGVTDAKLRDSAALSVIGRSANSSGDPADIAAGSDGDVLRRSGTTLGFGTVASAGIADNAVTDAKLRDSGALSVIGRSANSSGDPADISASADGQVLRRAAGVLGFGALDLDDADAVTGTLGLANGGTNADLSATGGANQIVKQTSAGGALSVATLGAGDVPDVALTSNVPLKNAANAFTSGFALGLQSVSSTPSTLTADSAPFVGVLLSVIGGPATVNLPGSGNDTGAVYVICDATGGAAANNITVVGNAGNIDGAANYVINTNYGVLRVFWTGTIWKTW